MRKFLVASALTLLASLFIAMPVYADGEWEYTDVDAVVLGTQASVVAACPAHTITTLRKFLPLMNMVPAGFEGALYFPAVNLNWNPALRMTELDLWSTPAHGPEFIITNEDIELLRHMTSLTRLNLFGNSITDISSLAGLTNLTYLNLSYNRVTDLTPLVGLTNLTFLGLTSNPIESITPLAGLTNLTFLGLNRTQVSDVTPLAGLVNLTTLGLNNNQITSILPLAGLTSLEWLLLSSNQIADISALAEFANLNILVLDGNQITDLSPLAGLVNFYDFGLDLRNNQIADWSPLDHLYYVLGRPGQTFPRRQA